MAFEASTGLSKRAKQEDPLPLILTTLARGICCICLRRIWTMGAMRVAAKVRSFRH